MSESTSTERDIGREEAAKIAHRAARRCLSDADYLTFADVWDELEKMAKPEPKEEAIRRRVVVDNGRHIFVISGWITNSEFKMVLAELKRIRSLDAYSFILPHGWEVEEVR